MRQENIVRHSLNWCCQVRNHSCLLCKGTAEHWSLLAGNNALWHTLQNKREKPAPVYCQICLPGKAFEWVTETR